MQPAALSLDEARALAARYEAENDRLEAPHRAAFEAFYRDLPQRRGVFFLFFTGGLMHFVVRCLSFIPQRVPVALVGSDLEADEIELARRLGRPFHYVELPVDDNTVLDFMTGVADESFGWMHIDCFVLNPGLFDEIAAIPDDAAMQCIWSTGWCGDVDVPHGALLFVNQRAVAELRRRGGRATPRTYHYGANRVGRHAPRESARALVPSAEELAVIGERVPLDDAGLPAYPEGQEYFPVFAMLRVATAALGYGMGRVRDLERGGVAGFDQYSDEILHVNGVATYRGVYQRFGDSDPDLPLVRFYPQLLQIDYVTLLAADRQVGGLPAAYRTRREELEAEMDRLGIDRADAPRNTFRFLISQGLRGDTGVRLAAA